MKENTSTFEIGHSIFIIPEFFKFRPACGINQDRESEALIVASLKLKFV